MTSLCDWSCLERDSGTDGGALRIWGGTEGRRGYTRFSVGFSGYGRGTLGIGVNQDVGEVPRVLGFTPCMGLGTMTI